MVQLLARFCTPRRQQHAHQVARLAVTLCTRFGVSMYDGECAGLAHDIARELDEGKIIRLASLDGLPLHRWELCRPVLLHGRASATLLEESCPVEEQILEAVRSHVVGKPGMSALSKIVFAADYLEPGRMFLDEALRHRMIACDLDTMVVCVLDGIFAYLAQRQQEPAAPSLQLYKELTGHDREIRAKTDKIG